MGPCSGMSGVHWKEARGINRKEHKELIPLCSLCSSRFMTFLLLRFQLDCGAAMQKYRHVINTGIQNNLTYRFNFLARSIFGLIPLIAVLYLWEKIYADKAGG